jgi:hypothetical protein
LEEECWVKNWFGKKLVCKKSLSKKTGQGENWCGKVLAREKNCSAKKLVMKKVSEEISRCGKQLVSKTFSCGRNSEEKDW